VSTAGATDKPDHLVVQDRRFAMDERVKHADMFGHTRERERSAGRYSGTRMRKIG
jgi:hypothetical protein